MIGRVAAGKEKTLLINMDVENMFFEYMYIVIIVDHFGAWEGKEYCAKEREKESWTEQQNLEKRERDGDGNIKERGEEGAPLAVLLLTPRKASSSSSRRKKRRRRYDDQDNASSGRPGNGRKKK